MTQTSSPHDIRDRVAKLLKTPSAGASVARQLSRGYENGRDCAAIGQQSDRDLLQHPHVSDIVKTSAAMRMLDQVGPKRH